MLTPEQNRAIAEPVEEAMAAYELALLSAMAERIMGLQHLASSEIAASALKLRVDASAARTKHVRNVSQAASEALSAGFAVNAMSEVV